MSLTPEVHMLQLMNLHISSSLFSLLYGSTHTSIHSYWKEGWVLKNWCFWTVVLEKTVESPLDCKEIQPVHPKGNQPWILIGRTDAEAPILWPLRWPKSWLIRKGPDAGKDWRQEEKGTTEDEMVGCHHRLNGHEFEQTLGDGEGRGSLACYSPGNRKESDTTERLNSNNTDTASSLSVHSLKFTLGVAHSVGLDKCMTCIHHFHVIQNTFIALKVLCSPPSHSLFSFPSP